MIYTLTLNPSIDYIAGVKAFELGKTNRTATENMFPGGKGINVSMMLRNLGVDSIALGYIAGFTGQEIRRRLDEDKINNELIEVKNGISRINIKLQNISETQEVISESEVNGQGLVIEADEITVLYNKLEALTENDVLVLSGSIPKGINANIYTDIMRFLKEKKVLIVVDASKDLLKNTLELHPFLIKPNNHELGELFNVTISNKQEAIYYAKKLLEMGAGNVLVFMAGDGAIFIAEDGAIYESEAPSGQVVNSVGAGDSMVAGFIYGFSLHHDYQEAFYYGLSAGSASAFSEGFATKIDVEDIYMNIVKN